MASMPMETDSDENKVWKTEMENRFRFFVVERSMILEDIKQFLRMVLSFFTSFEDKWKDIQKAQVVKSHVRGLMESLCFLHALYGYPAANSESVKLDNVDVNAILEKIKSKGKEKTEGITFALVRNEHNEEQRRKFLNTFDFTINRKDIEDNYTKKKKDEKEIITVAVSDEDLRKKLLTKFGTNLLSVNRNAVKEILKEIKGEGKKMFKHYCPEVENDEKFWEFDFQSGNFTNLVREPAHVFLQMIKNMPNTNTTQVPILYRNLLSGLPDVNKLKPSVLAECRNSFGVSLAVRTFVRPIYLYIKLKGLRSGQNVDSSVGLDQVTAYELYKVKSNREEGKGPVKKPCESCKNFFGGTKNSNPFGNCAEFDVILPDLDAFLKENATPWDEFEGACKAQFMAFQKLTQSLKGKEKSNQDCQLLLYGYHEETVQAGPMILKYKCSCGFQLITEACDHGKR